MNKHVKTNNIDTEIDHNFILTTHKTKGSVSNEEVIVKRDFSKFKENEFLMDLLGERWSEVYYLKDPTLIYMAITDILTSVLNKHAPLKTFKIGGNGKDGNKKRFLKNVYNG